jgi:Arc/MetJ-type ribon-helix-helix transcriptional regulator
MIQLVARVSDELAAGIDELVSCGLASSRSDAVRSALERWIDSERRRRVGEAIVEGYKRIPQTEEELAWADRAAAAMIAEEPW